MKIVYMGTPAFAVPPLVELVNAGHEVAAVITQPDRQKDRGKKLRFSAVKEKAVELALPVWQPDKIKGNQELFTALAALGADCFVVAAFGRILPKEILALPPFGCINIHGSLLPKYRGAAPVHRAILAGEPVAGVTIMQMEEGLDTGDMLSFCQTEIGKKTAAQLMEELSRMGAKLLVETLPGLAAGTLRPVPQDETLASYAPMLTKEEGRMDFNKAAVMLEREVRGLMPWPMAYTVYHGEVIKIWEAEVASQDYEEQKGISHPPTDAKKKPGEILFADNSGIATATGEGTLLITRLQFPGKKAVSVKDYLLGNKIEAGTRFGNEI